ncbi:hypothetical protein H5410_025365 [Solanum commersonii]|uniref:Uncharacterized protein n=1 Tax=Solanum commersonii TaxID=4109 RepID=A0A9J5YTJ9_SOLCO|nr:hypothetical protein H5410_025365 [Solanum commersonii]
MKQYHDLNFMLRLLCLMSPFQDISGRRHVTVGLKLLSLAKLIVCILSAVFKITDETRKKVFLDSIIKPLCFLFHSANR